jgi:hypothetical protein
MLHFMFLFMYYLFFLLMFLSIIAFATNFWILWGSFFFYCAHCQKKRLFVMLCEEKNNFPWCYVRCFDVYCKGCKISRSMWVHPCFFVTCLCLHTSIGHRVVLMDGGCCLMSSSLAPLAHIWFCNQLYVMGLLSQLQLRLKIVFVMIDI